MLCLSAATQILCQSAEQDKMNYLDKKNVSMNDILTFLYDVLSDYSSVPPASSAASSNVPAAPSTAAPASSIAGVMISS